jgi:hypothetical protein
VRFPRQLCGDADDIEPFAMETTIEVLRAVRLVAALPSTAPMMAVKKQRPMTTS